MQNACVPISLAQFNNILERSNSPSDLRRSFSFAEDNFKACFCLKTFIDATKFLIESYHDLNRKGFQICLKKIKQFFPNPTENDVKAVLEFQTKINVFFYYRFANFCPEVRVIVQQVAALRHLDAQRLHLKKLCSDEQLLRASEIFRLTDEERIKEAFLIESASTDMQKGDICQLMLNMLVLETDLMQTASLFYDDFLKYDKINKLTLNGCDRILRLSALQEMRLFKIPSNLENTDVFAFWLNLSPYIELSEDAGHLYASLKSTRISDIHKTKQYLNHLNASTPSDDVKFLITNYLASIERFFCGKNLHKTIKKVKKFLSDATVTALAARSFSDQLEYIATPCAYWLFSVFKQIFVNIAFDCPREMPEQDLQNIKMGLQFFLDIKERQRSLFSACLNELNLLAVNNPKYRKVFISFKKCLTENAAVPLTSLREYPSDYKIFGPSSTMYPQALAKGEELTLGIQNQKISSKAAIDVKPSTTGAGKGKSAPTFNASNKALGEVKPIKALSKKAPRDVHAQEAPLGTENKRMPLEITTSKDAVVPFPYKFDARVLRWREHPFKTPLPQAIFPEYADKALNYQVLMHLFHSLDLVDPFISKGMHGQWRNVQGGKNDIRIVLPAEIAFRGEKHRGLITYAIDALTQTCYHCFFTKKINQNILSLSVKRIFDENDFPELQKAASYSKSKPKQRPIKNSNARISEDPITGNVLIEDFERGVGIKLFNMQQIR